MPDVRNEQGPGARPEKPIRSAFGRRFGKSGPSFRKIGAMKPLYLLPKFL
jgi:hypothetical protein